ncbi:MAG: hypothetical protein RIC03_00195 [Cyclobacteriaceae bacterium]
MKKIQILTLLALVTLGASFHAHAKTWRVNNIPEVDADFTTAQAAHDDANVMPSDTLLFEGSPDTYGNITLIKKLVLIGPGYFLGENKGHQANPNSAKLSTVTFAKEPGVAPTVQNPDGINAISSQGSVMLGMEISTLNTAVPSLTIRRCKTGNVSLLSSANGGRYYGPISGIEYTTNSNNAVIIQSVIEFGLYLDLTDNVVVSNNVIASTYNQPTGNNITFTNNIVTSTSANSINLSNATVRNNIILGTSITPNNSTYSHNLAVGTSTLPAGNNNVNGVAVANLFVGASAGSTDGAYKLLNGSVATGAGFNGVDCGIFGGATPYVLSGIPPIPSIYEFTAPGIGTQTDGLQIQVKIKSNN